jgi:radical SAM protein with 4Fe4S-binding SPASM domain
LNNRVGTSWDPKIRFANDKQFELWYKNVKSLLENGVTIRLFVSVTKDTISIEPIYLLSWIKQLGVQEVSFERLTGNGSANKFPEIFPTNLQQDAWFLKMHEQSKLYGARDWFYNDFLETIYSKFETGFTGGGTFCRDCEEKIFTLNADGSVAGCPNSAPEEHFGNIEESMENLINNPMRLNNIACERNRNPGCYSCEVFQYCGGDCHQLAWQDDICGAPKSLMKSLLMNKKKIWTIRKEYGFVN